MKILSVFLCSTVMGLAVHAQISITSIHFPPRAKELETTPLIGITAMNHHSISSILTSLLEAYQRITAFKNELVSTRIPVPIPPPHQHCFISERDLSNFSPANVSHNLVCDVHLLNLLSLALQRVATFERCSNPQSEYYWVILRAKSTIESISHALANITRVHNDGLQDNTCGLPSLSALSSSGGQQRRCQVSNSLGSSPDAPEDRSRPARLRGQTTTQPAIPTLRPPTMSPPTTEPDGADPTDTSFYNLLFQRKRRANANPEMQDATPTSVMPTRCQVLDNVRDQFIYTYEVWLGLYYVQLDLCQKRHCLQ